jgi:hypothetical protein
MHLVRDTILIAFVSDTYFKEGINIGNKININKLKEEGKCIDFWKGSKEFFKNFFNSEGLLFLQIKNSINVNQKNSSFSLLLGEKDSKNFLKVYDITNINNESNDDSIILQISPLYSDLESSIYTSGVFINKDRLSKMWLPRPQLNKENNIIHGWILTDIHIKSLVFIMNNSAVIVENIHVNSSNNSSSSSSISINNKKTKIILNNKKIIMDDLTKNIIDDKNFTIFILFCNYLGVIE